MGADIVFKRLKGLNCLRGLGCRAFMGAVVTRDWEGDISCFWLSGAPKPTAAAVEVQNPEALASDGMARFTLARPLPSSLPCPCRRNPAGPSFCHWPLRDHAVSSVPGGISQPASGAGWHRPAAPSSKCEERTRGARWERGDRDWEWLICCSIDRRVGGY